MDNLAPVDPSKIDLPDGFTAADSSAGAAGGGASSDPANAEKKGRELQRQAILESVLLPAALERLRRIKLVKADKASAVESKIVSMAMMGTLKGTINEGKLIEMLEGLGAQTSGSSNKINIQRKKYAFDSDDDDDNDDDLL
mmetsp:Transcript_31827/g.46896  ORF Transcript_31827/g.46896 Transcript_31827/m.46896 type:complete len:141 (+) Transcript_31827:105-527(+)|eukprot:CAMPEP_0195521302 /NCGR_PEP_ID=MMETSP0794_2-20130614/18412_1 /TAXON_ID=515487 /ORGANISM="Stephanopyxis turris, Strain CCMP 815" /LENGTH=140 /DNA_ID=CAMNT_0040650823 /DNA_START=101 /DNA_END=523 /DNA_ORIENTATION=+